MIPASNNLLLASADEGYNLTRSLRFRSSASAYLSRTPASAGNQKTWTWSAWLKRGSLSGNQTLFQAFVTGGSYFWFLFGGDNKIYIAQNPSATIDLSTTQEFRDPSAWYHIVLAVDTTQATAANRVKLYVNGSQVTSFINTGYPTQNFDTHVNTTVHHNLGTSEGTGPSFTQNFDGYLTEINFIDGQALTPSSFGSTNTLTGVWQPARYTGTYGTNGFYLPFTDNSALTTSSNAGLGKDFSGNGNYWTTNNISITSGTTYDSMTDVPTLTSATAANFAVLNPLQNGGTMYNANMSFYGNSGSTTGTIAVTSGKWYWEVTDTTMGSGAYIGVVDNTWFGTDSSWTYSQTFVYLGSGNKGGNGSSVAYGATYTTGDLIGIALDMDNGTITFYKNNTSQGVAFNTGISGKTLRPFLGTASASNTTYDVNFGQRPFTYTPPTGYVALNTYNLPTSTIVKGNTVMDAVLYTGNGGTNTITNAAGFKPDFAWQKARGQAYAHGLYDSVRGVTKKLSSNSTDAEGTSSGLTAFNSNGITLGSDAGENLNASSFVSWQWQAGQGTTSTNTSGTITSTVSVNASAGFSVVTYTGISAAGTVGHGLGVAPSFIVVKDRSRAGWNWACYHSSLGATKAILLNSTAAAVSGSTDWNSTAPTSSIFSIPTGGGSYNTNYNGDSFVAYCWTPIAGYSAFGSYTGNGSADGPFVYTGFRPKYVMVKSTSNGENWIVLDTARDSYNLATKTLYPNSSSAEETLYNYADILSNGFKFRTTNSGTNGSGYSFIYVAFAETPTKFALAR